MSIISCDACNNLREYAPNFVQNGVDDTVAASLKNNTGLNPSLTVLHDNCEDLNDINDCLIGRMTDELEAYDVCEWKDFMRKHNSNLYETLKAIIMNDCGQWSVMCEHLTLLLGIVGGSGAKAHALSPTATFRAKFKNTSTPYWSPDDVFPKIEAEIRTGLGCGAEKGLSVWRTNISANTLLYPRVYGISVTDLQTGDVLGTIRKDQLVPAYMPAQVWENLMIGANLSKIGMINADTDIYVNLRGYIVINGEEINPSYKETYGPDVMTMTVSGFVGHSRSGYYDGSLLDTLHARVVGL